MMNIYKLKGDEERFLTFFIDASEFAKMGFEVDLSFDGKSKLDWWQTPNATFYEGDDYSKKSLSMPDISVYESFLVLNDSAFKALAPVLESYGEFLPVLSEGISYYLFNTLSTVDDSYIDVANSEKSVVNGIYMGLNKLNFQTNQFSENELIFRTSYDEFISVFCADKFKDLIEEASLNGLIFETNLASY